jgi:hypothetical protein
MEAGTCASGTVRTAGRWRVDGRLVNQDIAKIRTCGEKDGIRAPMNGACGGSSRPRGRQPAPAPSELVADRRTARDRREGDLDRLAAQIIDG